MLGLKNKAERVVFVEKYKSWGIWKQIPELNLVFYRYEFANGACIIVTEYQYYSAWQKKCETRNKLCLVLPEGDSYANESVSGSAEMYKYYEPTGCSMGTVVDYLTKSRDVI